MEKETQGDRGRGCAVAMVLLIFVLVVHGYHPYVEDGGLYIAGIKRLLAPNLYPAWSQFVTQHLRLSLFAPLVAAGVRGTGLPLPWVLLALYCGSVWITLYAAWMLAARCTPSTTGRYGAVALFACWFTLPIAGTSLLLMDPYVTARSVSTPLVLLALAWGLDASDAIQVTQRRRAQVLCFFALTFAAAVHPLMAGYGLAALLVLFCVGSKRPALRRWGPIVLCGCGLALAAILQTLAPRESADYFAISMTRYYWFPFRWKWYEQVGLIAPLLLIFAIGRTETGKRWRVLAKTALTLGGIALLIAAIFSRVGLATHLPARMQPLRSFQMVYEVMMLMLGAYVGEHWASRRTWRWITLLVVLGGIMFAVQRITFPASACLEMPWRAPTNPWAQAFLWSREHTPESALFALDSQYITHDGEDAQSFRALAERSALPDYSKDGGEAADTPELTDAWVRGESAQAGLETIGDKARIAALENLGTTWAIFERTTETSWHCPYINDAVKVCQLPHLLQDRADDSQLHGSVATPPVRMKSSP